MANTNALDGQARTFDVVIYQSYPDEPRQTCAITEYLRGETGQLSYVGREFLDEDDTARIAAVLTSIAARRSTVVPVAEGAG